MSRQRLVIFDVDGTLCDSQDLIVAAMAGAFAAEALPCPDRGAVLAIVGLSLPVAMARLAPEHPVEVQARLVEAYKATFMTERSRKLAPLYDGVGALIAGLSAAPDVVLGIATGKSRKGLRLLLQGHGLEAAFATQQVADDHPSKPHPSMLLAAMTETGIAPERAVMIGDTTFDVEMGRAAGIATIGVSWGYHPVAALERAGAGRIVTRAAEIPAALEHIWGQA
ncbi:MAG TPA: HAD-IA family hydrolase [Albidovulum sp.]|uniref:HAD-IA family hydrolase n=1 Tax=Albidovulum sp. TaxID=1872424 RepID=UPI002C6DB86A|nr:HAD-IA family hydrolase [Albidovulum sp.]